VFEDRVMRIFVSKREEVAGVWRVLCSEDPHNVYTSPDIKCSMVIWWEA
jgi:hypothetical protein